MLDVIAGKVVDEPQVVVTDGRITRIGMQREDAPSDARRIDLRGMTLPGPHRHARPSH
jgi:imidazolonepropionase-like amidohydrolase